MKFKSFLRKQLEDKAFADIWYETDPSFEAGNLLVKLRAKFGLSQEELAQKASLKRPYVARIESGEANPTVRTLGRILGSLGLSLILDTEPRKAEYQSSSIFIDMSSELRTFQVEPVNILTCSFRTEEPYEESNENEFTLSEEAVSA